MTMTEGHPPVYRTATIRKLKRTHDDVQRNFDSDFVRTSTLKPRNREQLFEGRSRPILRSASVIKTRHIKDNLCTYGAYTDDQPENLIFRRGQLKLIVCGSDDCLSVTILGGRSLPQYPPDATAWVEVHLLPGGTSAASVSQTSTPVPASQPEFSETFTFEINERPQSGSKLFICLFFEANQSVDFIGCMSFGVRKILQEKSITKGWYYLLSETLGKRKHLVVSKQSNDFRQRQSETSGWSSTSSSTTSSSTMSNFGEPETTRKYVRWGQDTVFAVTPVKSRPQNDFGDSLHGQDIAALEKKSREQETRVELKVQRGWCGFGFTLVGESPVQVETVFNDCVGDQAGLLPGDVIVAANDTELTSLSGKEVQRAILRVVAELQLSVIRQKPMKPKAAAAVSSSVAARYRRPRRRRRNPELCESPAKITCRYESDSEDSEDTDDFDDAEITSRTEQLTLNPRMKGMDTLLRYDSGINRVNLLQEGRDFVYSGSCLVRISGMSELQRVWLVLLTDMLLVCVYDPIDRVYLIIEEVIHLGDCSLQYEAITPEGTPDLKWLINVADQRDFGPRRYTFEADTVELAAMWKCCLSRQIDLTKQLKMKSQAADTVFSSPAPLRTKSEADMNRIFGSQENLSQRQAVADPAQNSGAGERHGIKNRRKSLGAGRLDFGVAELMSRARESIRNRRRSSFAASTTTNSASGNSGGTFNNNTNCGGQTIRSSSPRPLLPETLAEESSENCDVFAFGLKSSSNQSDISFDQLSPIKSSKKSSTSSLLKKNVSNTTLTSKTSETDSLAASSLESGNSQCSAESDRKSIPERVNFAATWVSARLLKRHRERRARRQLELEKETSDQNQAEGYLHPAADRFTNTCTASASSIASAAALLSGENIEVCRSGLPAVIDNEACLGAFREFLKKEHSDENLEFWLEAERFKNAEDDDRIEIAASILENFIRFGATQEVNINSEMNRQVTAGLEEVPPSSGCLIDAQEHVFKLMQTDTYSRFVKSLPSHT